MGQVMTRLLWRLLGRGGEETAGTCTLFDLYWKLAKAILRFLRQLLGLRPSKEVARRRPPLLPLPPPLPLPLPPPPPTGPLHRYIDREKEQQVIVETTSVAEVEIGSVTVAEASGGGGQVAGNLPVPEQPKLGPYSADQRILLVGEGDFSFARSLAVAFGDASNLVATSLDSLEFLKENYKRAESNILALTSRGCKVMHGVDATTMVISHPQLRSLKFNCILFNYPRVAFSDPKPPRDAQLSKHQGLISAFLANAKQMIRDDGQIHITHQCFGAYLEWNIQTLGSSEGLRLVEELPFNSKEYPGYRAKYGCGGDGSFDCNPSMTYKFQLPCNPKKKTRRKRKKIEAVLI